MGANVRAVTEDSVSVSIDSGKPPPARISLVNLGPEPLFGRMIQEDSFPNHSLLVNLTPIAFEPLLVMAATQPASEPFTPTRLRDGHIGDHNSLTPDGTFLEAHH